MPSAFSACCATLLLLFAGAGAADPEPDPAPNAPAQLPTLPPWMGVDVIKAAVAMNMTDAQKPEFNKIVSQYLTNHFAMIQKEIKRNSPNLPMRIKSRDRSLVHKMDDAAHKVLTKEQWPAYEDYKKALNEGLAKAAEAAPPVPSEPRSGPAVR